MLTVLTDGSVLFQQGAASTAQEQVEELHKKFVLILPRSPDPNLWDVLDKPCSNPWRPHLPTYRTPSIKVSDFLVQNLSTCRGLMESIPEEVSAVLAEQGGVHNIGRGFHGLKPKNNLTE